MFVSVFQPCYDITLSLEEKYVYISTMTYISRNLEQIPWDVSFVYLLDLFVSSRGCYTPVSPHRLAFVTGAFVRRHLPLTCSFLQETIWSRFKQLQSESSGCHGIITAFTLSVLYINSAAHLALLTTTIWPHFVRTPTSPLFIGDPLTVCRDTFTMSSIATRKVVHSLSPARHVPDMRGAAKQDSVAVNPIRLPYK